MRHEKIKSLAHEEELYKRANELSRKLKIPFTELVMGVSLICKDGTRKPVMERHSRSLVRNFYSRHQFHISGANNSSGYTDGGLQAKDVDGVIRELDVMFCQKSMENNPYPHAFAAGAGVATQGIQIGTGNTAESFDDFKIETLIEHGLTSGKMGYLTTAHTFGWHAGGNYYCKNFERVMDNDSGGTINVTESTIVWRSSQSRNFLMSRDVFSAVAILHNEGIAIFYEFRTTYP
jgi:hypothetical protein